MMNPSSFSGSTQPSMNSSTSRASLSRFAFADGTTLEQFKKRWLCRAEVVTLLWRFLGGSGRDSWPFLFVHGPSGTGKSHIIQDYCTHIKCPTAYVDCVGTSTIRYVFESVLNQFARHIPCEANSYTNYCRCDDMPAFVQYLKKLLALESRGIIIFDSCERLRSSNVGSRLLDSLVRLSELSKLNLTVIFVSPLPWDRMMPNVSAAPVATALFPPYSEDEMRTLLCTALAQQSHLPSSAVLVNKLLPQFWPECRVFDRLLPVFAQLYQRLCAPVLDGSVECSQTAKLLSLAKPHFDLAVRSMSGKVSTDYAVEGSVNNVFETRDRADSLPLPRIARLLLLASFFASYNPPRTDSMHFCESTLGRKRQRLSKIQQIKDFEQFQTGPKVFTWERWLAIYYALLKQTSGEQPHICSEEIGQVSVLVSMDLVVSVGGDVRNPKYKCNTSLATCEKMAKELKIDFSAHFHGA